MSNRTPFRERVHEPMRASPALDHSRLPHSSASYGDREAYVESRMSLQLKHAKVMELLDAADQSRSANDYLGAAGVYLQCLEEMESIGSPSSLKARGNAGLGVCCDALGRVEDAVHYYEAALACYTAMNTSAHWRTQAALQNNLGILYRSLGRMEEAESCYVQAINTYSSSSSKLPALVEEVIMLHHNLACLYYKNGLLLPAFEMESTALSLRQSTPSPDKVKHFTILRTLGIFAVEAGKLYAGVEHLRHAYELIRHLVPPAYEATVDVLINLGAACLMIDETDQALEMLTEAAQVQAKSGAAKDLQMAYIQNQMGCLYHRLGDGAKAYESFRKGLAILDSDPSASEASKAEAHHNLSVAASLMNRPLQAAAHRQSQQRLLDAAGDTAKYPNREKVSPEIQSPLSHDGVLQRKKSSLFVRVSVRVEASRPPSSRFMPPLKTETVETSF